jgi:uncharacterized protein
VEEERALSIVQEIEAALPATSTKWLHCNGHQLRKMAKAGLIWLEKNRAHVNALNVFPVPDGDTGTNMLLTMQSAYSRVEHSEEIHVGKVTAQLAQGALMGARGNSGVILSQIWRGLASGLAQKEMFSAADLAQALQNASDTAYKGVMRPVEGTILTVIREGAAEANDAAAKSEDLRFMLERILERCQQALEKTPDLLPILKQAGVVDSGGQGLVYIFEGMLRYAHGQLDLNGSVTEPSSAPPSPLAGSVPDVSLPAQARVVPEGGSLEFPYDVQFILLGSNLNVAEVRDTIDAMGDSTVVVGDENAIKVHIHVKDPGQPISYGISLGQITDVVVENMQEQMEDIVNQGSPATADMPPAAIPQPVVAPGQIGVVAVASGPGLATVFQSLGASYVVNGGQSNNPSTEEILKAIEDLPTDKVIILPNNKNIFLAAEAARDLSRKDVAVVPSRTIPQGISALMAVNPAGDVQANAEMMEKMLSTVRTGEITRATRSVELDGVAVKEGALIGLVDGRLCSSGPDEDPVLDGMLERLAIDECEIITVYFGLDVRADEAERLAMKLESRYPDVEVEIVNGGQPHYFYILGVE